MKTQYSDSAISFCKTTGMKIVWKSFKSLILFVIIPKQNTLTQEIQIATMSLSIGASTFMGLRKFIIDQSKTRVRCLLHIALHGLAAAGCSSGGMLIIHVTCT